MKLSTIQNVGKMATINFTENIKLPGNPEYDSRTPDGRSLQEHIMEDKLWGEIRRAARTNPALHEALERAKIIYHLSKE